MRDWRFGQTQAERLCAHLLHIERFEDVDPQSPLGGPDGKKDVVCSRNGKRWVAAVHFPPTQSTAAAIEKKFKDDLQGVTANRADAFVFFVNQHMTPGERTSLIDIAEPVETEVYHLERIASLLDSPKGYGIRLQYLQIPMTTEEQLAFWSAFDYDITRKLLDNESRLVSIDRKLDQVLHRTRRIEDALEQPSSSVVAGTESAAAVDTPTRDLSLAMLCWLHRLATADIPVPDAVRGRLRSVQVWIGKPDDPTFTPAPPEHVPELIRQLLRSWTQQHAMLQGQSKDQVVARLAQFHHQFLTIHPFLDANGRVARIVLDQAAQELLGVGVGDYLTSDADKYYKALRAADDGEVKPLQALIAGALACD